MGGGRCQHATKPPFQHCKRAFCSARRVNSVGLRCGGKHALQCRDVGTCGRIGADSCARVPPYCSFWAVGYDISCGSSDPKSPFCTAYTFGRGFRARRGLRDSDRRDFLRRMTSPALPRLAGAMRREECDDGIDLVRRSRRATEKALGGRIIGQPDRRGTRKCDAKRRDRQSAPAGPVRPRQEPLLGRPAAAQGAPRPAHDAGVAPGLARQHRACARLRGRDGARSDRLRQRGADEPAAVAARTERSHLPLAGRRSLEPGILLLRRQGALGPALLRASLARGVSAGRRSPPAGSRSRRGKGGRIASADGAAVVPANAGTHNHSCIRGYALAGAASVFNNRDLWLWARLRVRKDDDGSAALRRRRRWSATAPPSQTDHPAHSPRRARCGSGPARGRG